MFEDADLLLDQLGQGASGADGAQLPHRILDLLQIRRGRLRAPSAPRLVLQDHAESSFEATAAADAADLLTLGLAGCRLRCRQITDS
ncbi:hypothetical protein [Microvirga subterranea]|uniref:hypothetical protein n=1 Tax=Microvirga subterranea TaxID=186651 RepID=UPI000E0C61C1|nr:hypothetical protein [Microvirga subterranea]